MLLWLFKVDNSDLNEKNLIYILKIKFTLKYVLLKFKVNNEVNKELVTLNPHFI